MNSTEKDFPDKEERLDDKKELCILCAWRATCQKQFSMRPGQRCPDFSRDLTIREEKEAEKNEVKQG
ncbi:MAG: hypothetical protein HGA78_01265 [Nitrospirales bacterium]|nr:hypothetical protein [Nitrospirales bacterium]